MTQMLVRQQPVPVPQRQSPPGSILNCANVIDVDQLWWGYGAGMWTSAGCGNSQILPNPLCVEGESAELGGSGITYGLQKEFADPVWAHSHSFAVYRSLACNVVGFSLTTTDLENAFDAAEGRAVGHAIWETLDQHDDTVDIPNTTGEAMCNFGLLADYTLDQYGGQPVFLLPANMAVALQADRVLNPAAGGGYTTAVGGCIAIGANMTSALALGMLVILRTPRITREVIDPHTNILYLLTERLYMFAVDCDFAARIPNTINCGALP